MADLHTWACLPFSLYFKTFLFVTLSLFVVRVQILTLTNRKLSAKNTFFGISFAYDAPRISIIFLMMHAQPNLSHHSERS